MTTRPARRETCRSMMRRNLSRTVTRPFRPNVVRVSMRTGRARSERLGVGASLRRYQRYLADPGLLSCDGRSTALQLGGRRDTGCAPAQRTISTRSLRTWRHLPSARPTVHLAMTLHCSRYGRRWRLRALRSPFLAGACAALTGGGSGIGRAIAPASGASRGARGRRRRGRGRGRGDRGGGPRRRLRVCRTSVTPPYRN